MNAIPPRHPQLVEIDLTAWSAAVHERPPLLATTFHPCASLSTTGHVGLTARRGAFAPLARWQSAGFETVALFWQGDLLHEATLSPQPAEPGPVRSAPPWPSTGPSAELSLPEWLPRLDALRGRTVDVWLASDPLTAHGAGEIIAIERTADSVLICASGFDLHVDLRRVGRLGAFAGGLDGGEGGVFRLQASGG